MVYYSKFSLGLCHSYLHEKQTSRIQSLVKLYAFRYFQKCSRRAPCLYFHALGNFGKRLQKGSLASQYLSSLGLESSVIHT